MSGWGFYSAERARDPDTSLRDLRRLAGAFPEEVLGNPALPLLALEDPGLYAEVIRLATRRARIYRARRHLEKLLEVESWQKALRAAYRRYDLSPRIPGSERVAPYPPGFSFVPVDQVLVGPIDRTKGDPQPLYVLLAMSGQAEDEPVAVWVTTYDGDSVRSVGSHGRYLGEMEEDRALVIWPMLQLPAQPRER